MAEREPRPTHVRGPGLIRDDVVAIAIDEGRSFTVGHRDTILIAQVGQRQSRTERKQSQDPADDESAPHGGMVARGGLPWRQ